LFIEFETNMKIEAKFSPAVFRAALQPGMIATEPSIQAEAFGVANTGVA